MICYICLQVLHDSVGEGGVSKSVLKVEPLVGEALGLYQCRAENYLGHSEDSLQLIGEETFRRSYNGQSEMVTKFSTKHFQTKYHTN